MAVLGPVVIYCYTAPVRSCIESHHSKTESEENARNATYINNEEFAPSERSSRGTCHTAGWKSVRIQTPAAVPSLHSFVNVTAVEDGVKLSGVLQ